MSKLTAAEISEKLTSLLSELAAAEVHVVVVAAAGSREKMTTFGVETNTGSNVATMLLKAGLDRINELA